MSNICPDYTFEEYVLNINHILEDLITYYQSKGDSPNVELLLKVQADFKEQQVESYKSYQESRNRFEMPVDPGSTWEFTIPTQEDESNCSMQE